MIILYRGIKRRVSHICTGNDINSNFAFIQHLIRKYSKKWVSLEYWGLQSKAMVAQGYHMLAMDCLQGNQDYVSIAQKLDRSVMARFNIERFLLLLITLFWYKCNCETGCESPIEHKSTLWLDAWLWLTILMVRFDLTSLLVKSSQIYVPTVHTPDTWGI